MALGPHEEIKSKKPTLMPAYQITECAASAGTSPSFAAHEPHVKCSALLCLCGVRKKGFQMLCHWYSPLLIMHEYKMALTIRLPRAAPNQKHASNTSQPLIYFLYSTWK